LLQWPIDRKQLPESADVLATDGARSDAQLETEQRAREDRTPVAQLLRTKRTFQPSASEDQLALFAAELKGQIPEAVEMAKDDAPRRCRIEAGRDSERQPSGGAVRFPESERERILHDLAEARSMQRLHEELRRIGEESASATIHPAQMR